jgi:hypothetical protein
VHDVDPLFFFPQFLLELREGMQVGGEVRNS